jgi:RNA recognition motif. (a.k.a. RRM, RBD, or RNP domain)
MNDKSPQFGEIIECRVLKDRNSQGNKEVAFVQFNLKSQANNGKCSGPHPFFQYILMKHGRLHRLIIDIISRN